jgi:thioesterase domain-containing protein
MKPDDGGSVMLDGSQLSEAKRALLERYRRGDLPRPATTVVPGARSAEALVAGRHAGVVAVQSGKSKRPFFFLHGQWIREVGALCFPLARQLGPDQPFYMVEPNTFDDPKNLPTLETIAAKHIKALRAVQPDGPYLLGGFCNGGLVAYEMARQLHADGQKVDLLALMDPLLLVQPPRLKLAFRFIKRYDALMRVKVETQVAWFLCLRNAYSYLQDVDAYARHRMQMLKVLLRRNSAETVNIGSGRDNSAVAFPRLASIVPKADNLLQDYPGVFTWVALHYKPATMYPGKISFFWPTSSTSRRGWRAVEEVNDVEVHIIPGRSMSLLTDGRARVAEYLRACLSKVHGTTTAHS